MKFPSEEDRTGTRQTLHGMEVHEWTEPTFWKVSAERIP